MYQVFHRTWWDKQGNPKLGRKTEIQKIMTIEGARRLCEEWNALHEPGKQSRKAEFTKL